MLPGTCKHKIKGKICGYPLVEIVLMDDRTARYCKNKGCDNYYKCPCGKEFGKHFPPAQETIYEQGTKEIQEGDQEAQKGQCSQENIKEETGF